MSTIPCDCGKRATVSPEPTIPITEAGKCVSAHCQHCNSKWYLFEADWKRYKLAQEKKKAAK